MKEHPILFSGEMVRAILEGRKTMTRRVAKYKGTGGLPPMMNEGEEEAWCPYGQVGDRLWVRETWRGKGYAHSFIEYRADMGCKQDVGWGHPLPVRWGDGKWKPSIHMPRWASRITLEITGVKVERVRDISMDDAWNECVPIEPSWPYYEAVEHFRRLWDSINYKRGFGWDVNPWVWAITFKVVE